jgi:anti-anti-sigma factor
MNLELRSHISDDTAFLHCDGSIRASESGRLLRANVTNLLHQCPRVVVDLSRIDYIDSRGLAVLVSLYSAARCAGSKLQYRNLTTAVDYRRSAASDSATWLQQKAS